MGLTVVAAGQPGDPARPSEDWVGAVGDLAVVLDGATVRTATGCAHGVPWYVDRLGTALVDLAGDRARALRQALRDAIRAVADRHPTCDLAHPGTPSAALAVLRTNGDDVEYLALGDVTVVLDHGELTVVTDDRVDRTAPDARRRVHTHPPGTPERAAALIAMKHAELAARNRPGGYWVAASDPAAADHALTGTLPATAVRRAALLTDGAARAVTFGLLDWPGVLDLLGTAGPAALIRAVRAAEATDPAGERWPRNKSADDATVAFASRPRRAPGTGTSSRHRR